MLVAYLAFPVVSNGPTELKSSGMTKKVTVDHPPTLQTRLLWSTVQQQVLWVRSNETVKCEREQGGVEEGMKHSAAATRFQDNGRENYVTEVTKFARPPKIKTRLMCLLTHKMST